MHAHAAPPSSAPASSASIRTGRYTPSLLEVARIMRREGLLGLLMQSWRSGGDLAYVRVGFAKPLFLVTHPEHVRHISVTHRQNYEKLASYDSVRDLLMGQGIVGVNGEDWRRQRKLMAPFFTPRAVEKFHAIFVADSQRLSERWLGLQGRGQPVDMFDEMMQVTASIILHALFSTETDETLQHIREAVESNVAFTSGRQMELLPIPLWVPTPGNRRFQRTRRNVDRYIRGVVERRRALPQEQWPEDLLTRMLTARDEETGGTMADQLVVDNGVSLFVAGHETTARTLGFLWYALSQHPEVEARMHAELDAVPGDAPPTLDDLRKLPYTLRVIKEVMRLYPPVTMYPRDAVADDELAGMHIPAGARVMLFAYGTHRHPDYWEDPERFDPDRWLPEREAARDPHAYHPFASGHRICLGNNFSLLETHVVAVMLARRFKVRLKPGHQARIDTLGMLRVSNGLPMFIEPR
ncbi:cytochrome P450 [Pyxidicoccus fallax]|uniref:Cytochrome P450 n=1 Tax=Pyxidicoccus fallax TaxID=394095 RepID=A0A848LNP8_9BACT|nr:cytochrome P450 [Pyxidicoccus fallax]NMO19233.1 cytochrome P450 [Pyxidicoccus fallax]NPC85686.1 cytochrome P450 [Pyxidicoccus fallax]